MFTGIVEELGRVARVEHGGDAARLTVEGVLAVSDADRGDSIAVSGVCLTVVDLDDRAFTADVMAATLAASTLGAATEGTAVNLERAARLGDRLGGHLVQGHVDGVATVISVVEGSAWRVVRFRLPAALAPLVAAKGSIAVDGVSLTVSALGDGREEDGAGNADAAGIAGNIEGAGGGDAGDGHWFEVSLIPETLTATTLGRLTPGDTVNIETDMLARAAHRIVSFTESRNGS